jgi:hypothetical protein
MPGTLGTGADSDSDRDGDSEDARESWQPAASRGQKPEAEDREPRVG